MEEIVYPIAGWWQADNLGRLLHSVSDKTVIASCLVHAFSVHSPYILRTYRYGEYTENIRSRHGSGRGGKGENGWKRDKRG